MTTTGEVRILRSSFEAWCHVGVDPHFPEGRILVRGRMAGREKTISISRAEWDDPRRWRSQAAEGSTP